MHWQTASGSDTLTLNTAGKALGLIRRAKEIAASRTARCAAASRAIPWQKQRECSRCVRSI
eukprot:scaffold1523_cov426-Prasinococcus_capsulatus_cf.AAC.11